MRYPYPLPADLDDSPVEIPLALPVALRVADVLADSWPASMGVREFAARKAELLMVLQGKAVPTYATSRVGFWSEVLHEVH